MDKTPQKFNPEALKIIKEVEELTPPAGWVAKCALELIEIRNEVREELKKQAKIMRDIAKNGEKRMEQLKESTKEKVSQVEAKHKDIMRRAREAQPELKDIEFKIDFDNGTYTPTGPLEKKEQKGKEIEEATPEMMASIQDMVGDLLKRVGKS